MAVTGNQVVDLSLMEKVFGKYQGQKGALIPILQTAQDTYGYLAPEVLKLISQKLELSPSQVYGVATFYAQFWLEPRGRHTLKVCDGTACHVKGTPKLMAAIEGEFGINPGQTSDDGELTVEVVYCLGSCALAPVSVFDTQVMGRMRPDSLVDQVKTHIAGDQEADEAPESKVEA